MEAIKDYIPHCKRKFLFHVFIYISLAAFLPAFLPALIYDDVKGKTLLGGVVSSFLLLFDFESHINFPCVLFKFVCSAYLHYLSDLRTRKKRKIYAFV